MEMVLFSLKGGMLQAVIYWVHWQKACLERKWPDLFHGRVQDIYPKCHPLNSSKLRWLTSKQVIIENNGQVKQVKIMDNRFTSLFKVLAIKIATPAC